MKQIILSKDELDYYINENERRNNAKHNFHVGEIVKIGDELGHDIGYANEIGVVINWSTIDEYVTVVAYDNRAKRYWACGFEEKDLIKCEKKWNELSTELTFALYYWIYSNYSHCLPKENVPKSKKDLINITLTKEEYEAMPILISMSQIYLWELYNKKETDSFYEQHKENIELIQQYHNKGYQGIMANASEILKKIN